MLSVCGVIASLWGAPCSAVETITNSIGMKLVLIPAGKFMMGAVEDGAGTVKRFPYAHKSWVEDEFPRHEVRITRPFYLGAHEVTLGQFLTFYHDAKYKLDSERDGRENWGYDARNKLVESRAFSAWSPGWRQTYDHPIVYVSWNDATAFCDWLSRKEGRTYRLPREAEWEYACRAGTTSLFSNGNDPEKLTLVANVADATAHEHWPNVNLVVITAKEKKKNLKIPFPFLSTHDGYAYTAPVGSFRPNAFGVYDTHGNVWEWCSDYYSRDYYSQSPVEDPTGKDSGTERVLRGGGWYNAAARVRASDRSSARPDRRFYMWGFRVVYELPPLELEVDGLNGTF
ncbi:MAG TPA: formylglycine-generating enzyme family protein [Pirellulales bacterium]|nr:formylglycine-generating enzyme family protein [Pirellulales bacterium]